jgi:hypothetical protein
MPGPVFLEDERVELRVTEREDIDLLQRVRTDPELRTAMTFTEPQTREQVEEFYENTISTDNGDSNFVVCVDGEPVGEANLFRVEADHGEIAYWLDRDARGEGYATEAVSLLRTTPSTPGVSTGSSPRSWISTTRRECSWNDWDSKRKDGSGNTSSCAASIATYLFSIYYVKSIRQVSGERKRSKSPDSVACASVALRRLFESVFMGAYSTDGYNLCGVDDAPSHTGLAWQGSLSQRTGR